MRLLLAALAIAQLDCTLLYDEQPRGDDSPLEERLLFSLDHEQVRPEGTESASVTVIVDQGTPGEGQIGGSRAAITGTDLPGSLWLCSTAVAAEEWHHVKVRIGSGSETNLWVNDLEASVTRTIEGVVTGGVIADSGTHPNSFAAGSTTAATSSWGPPTPTPRFATTSSAAPWTTCAFSGVDPFRAARDPGPRGDRSPGCDSGVRQGGGVRPRQRSSATAAPGENVPQSPDRAVA